MVAQSAGDKRGHLGAGKALERSMALDLDETSNHQQQDINKKHQQTNKLQFGDLKNFTTIELGKQTDSTTPNNNNFDNDRKKVKCNNDDTNNNSNLIDGNQDLVDDKTDLDSGYAWTILIVMFFVNSFFGGAVRIYGLVYAREIASNYYSHEQASWPIATASTVENLTGLLTPMLASRLTWRQIQMLSAGLIVLSNLIAYFSDSLWLDILSLGCVQGVSLSMFTVLSLAINNDYFDKYRVSAHGLAMSGGTCSIFYLGPIFTWILGYFENFRVAYLAVAVMMTTNIFLAMLIVPRSDRLKLAAKRKKKLEAEKASDKMHQLSRPHQHPPQHTKLGPQASGGSLAFKKISARLSHALERKDSLTSIAARCESRRQLAISLWSTNNSENTTKLGGVGKPLGVASLAVAANDKYHQSMRLASNNSAALRRKLESRQLVKSASSVVLSSRKKGGLDDSIPGLARPNETSVTVAGYGNDSLAMSPKPSPRLLHWQLGSQSPSTSLKLYERDVMIARLREEKQNLPDEYALTHTKDLTNKTLDCDDSKDQMKFKEQHLNDTPKTSTQLLIEKLLCPYVHCVWIMLAIYYVVARVYVMILADFTHDHGFSLSDSSFLLNFWSLGELLGRIVLGSLIDMHWLSVKSNIIVVALMISVSIIPMVLFENLYIYAMSCTMTAALVSLEYMLINVLIIEYMGREKVTSTYAIASLLTSPILFVRPLLIGFFRGYLDSYDGLFLTLAAFTGLFALLFALFEPLMVKYYGKACNVESLKLNQLKQQQQQQKEEDHETEGLEDKQSKK